MNMQTTSLGARALRESFFDNTSDGLAYCQMVFDARGRPVDFIYRKVNRNFEKMTGLKRVIGKRATKIIPGISLSNPELFEAFSRISLGGGPESFEIYAERASQWFFVSAYSPRKKFFVAVFQNITERKRIEKDLRDAKIAARNVLEDLSVEKSKFEMAQAKEEAILMSIGDGLIATDERGYIILINKTAEELLGKKRGEAMWQLLSEAVRIEDEKGAPVLLENRPTGRALASGKATSITTAGPTYYYVRTDASRFPVAITATPVMLEGKVIGTIEVFRDITREKEIDRAKSEFVSLASHQLRTPPTSMNWYLEMLLKEDVGPLNSKQNDYLNEVYENNKRMISLINGLLNVSRMEMGTLEVDPQHTDIPRLVADVVRELQPHIAARQMRLTQHMPAQLSAFLDPKLFVIILANLLSNAIKYTPIGGSIDVTIGEKKRGEKLGLRAIRADSLTVTVSDTGFGIPKGQQDKIFTKLFRADNVKVKDTDGTGLGLYLVKLIVDHSQGELWFDSEEDKGTAFFIALPLQAPHKGHG